ncbi:MAG TPA: protein-glutamate O-methyltransferase CheR [Blastocatellia bacterium]|nr:protein-glutamate O-methyltransferase CheR [Blastocatellia bacterium]
MATATNALDLENIELELLLEAIYRGYGYDFRQYARASLKRRIIDFARDEQIESLSVLQDKVLHNAAVMDRLLLAITVNVSSMFRDPAFFLAFRAKVIPYLRTYPFIRIWHAGCSTGEEVYSMAILLEEEGLADRTRIYATDMNQGVLQKAREGIFRLSAMQDYTKNYLDAGGMKSFSEYYTAAYDHAILRPALRRNVVFAQHNLVTDSTFNEFHVIVCRNVMIYFNRALQSRVHELLHQSLVLFGMLGLGNKENMRFTPHEQDYDAVDREQKIYRRVK